MNPNSCMKPRYKRTIDIVPPPDDGVNVKQFTTTTRSVAWLVAEFERGRFTGAIRSSLDTRKHRSVMLLYEGRVVGCIRSSFAGKPVHHSTEASLKAMLADLALVGTDVSYYALDDKVVIPLSGFFIGEILEMDEIADPSRRVEAALSFIYQQKKTACLVGYYDNDTVLSLFFDGLHHVSYCPGETGFITTIEEVGTIFARSSQVMIEVFQSPDADELAKRQAGFKISAMDELID